MSDAQVTFLISRLAIASVEFLAVGILVSILLAAFPGISPGWRRWIWLVAMFKPFATILISFTAGVVPVPSAVVGLFLGDVMFPAPGEDGPLMAGGMTAALLRLAVWAWACGTVLLLVRVWCRSRNIGQVVDELLDKGFLVKSSKLKRIAPGVEVPGKVRIIVTPEEVGPAAAGVMRPAVVIPESFMPWLAKRQHRDPTREERERFCQVLHHEIAHIANRDELISQVARIMLSVFWFHPVAHWAYRRVRVNGELCCDQRVVETGVKPSDYAATLIMAVADGFSRRKLSLGMLGDSGPKSLLKHRLQVLDSMDEALPPRHQFCGFLVFALLLLTMPRYVDTTPAGYVDIRLVATGEEKRIAAAELPAYRGIADIISPGGYDAFETMLASASIQPQAGDDESLSFPVAAEPAGPPTETGGEADASAAVDLGASTEVLARAANDTPTEVEPAVPAKEKSRHHGWSTGPIVDPTSPSTPILPPPNEHR